MKLDQLELVRAACGGHMAHRTLAGRQLPVSATLRASDGSGGRERAAAAAAVLGEVCDAGADEVSGALIGRLGRTGPWRLRVHGREELLFWLADGGEAAALGAAVRVAAEEAARDLQLSVPIAVEMEVGASWGAAAESS